MSTKMERRAFFGRVAGCAAGSAAFCCAAVYGEPQGGATVELAPEKCPINASDLLWAKLKLGERYKILDPDTARPATRNVYLGSRDGGRPDTVLALQARGAVFMMCNKSMNGLTNEFSQELGRPRADVYAELSAGLNAGVKVVPALTWALSTLQERGFTYAKL